MKIIKHCRYLILALVALIYSTVALATDYTITSICALQSLDTSSVAFMQPCGGWPTKNNCTNSDWISWNIDEGQGKAMYATALTAFALGEKVRVRLNGNSCLSDYDHTKMIRITK